MLELLWHTGVYGIILGILALLGLGLIIERLIVYNSESTKMEGFVKPFEELVLAKRWDEALALCASHRGHIPYIFGLALRHRDEGLTRVRHILRTAIELDVVPKLQSRLSALATIAKTAPMLGLLGTVHGMIQAFTKIAGQARTGVDPADLASEIGLALGTTLEGLFIAIPIIFVLTYFRTRVQRFELDLQLYTEHVLELLRRSS
jgi:biopolymer transport protein ExbB